MKQKKAQGKAPLVWKITSVVFVLLFAVTMIGGPIANNYASIINMVLGTESTKTIGDPGQTYFEADYTSSEDQAAAAAETCESVVANGATLLMNNNALPLAQGAKVTLFGTTSADFVYGGTGSGGMDTSNATNLKDALESDGFSVNPTLWDFYTTGAGSSYGLVTASGSLNNYIFNNAEFLVNEVPQSAYTDTEWNSVAGYGDAAIVVFGRICGEGADLPWYGAGDADGNILSLSAEERALLQKLADLKAAGQIKKIVVLLNATNPIELDFLNPAIGGTDYGIDACLWVGEVGQTGTATVTVDKSEMRTYDANGAKTYIVDAGNYYFAAGNGAHEALNNILAAKAALGDTANGTVDTAKMTAPGNAALAAQYNQAAQDNTTYATAVTGAAITNQLDHGDLNKVDDDTSNDIVYLSRSDWAGTMPRRRISCRERDFFCRR